jgi:methylated-DNA-[protein]-cysteine S-methyltransferase
MHSSSAGPDWFTVPTALTDLAVSVRGTAVTGIRLGARGTRAATTEAERLVADELQAYARGDLETFSFAVDPAGTDFDHRVWQAVARIPYGATETYGAIARTIGVPGGARAVGHANGRNPLPLVIPCHRVVAAGGGLGGYGGGIPLKRRLLALEARVRGFRAVVGGLLVALVVLASAACSDPERPIFTLPESGVDTIGPTIEFLPANADSVFPSGSLIAVRVRVSDRHLIRQVTAGVQGIVNFGFATEFPDDTAFTAEFRIQAPDATLGLILFSISATDELENRSSTNRTFRLE